MRLYIVNEHSDKTDVVEFLNLRVIENVSMGRKSQALIYVSGAVPSGTGIQGLGRQGLGFRVEDFLILTKLSYLCDLAASCHSWILSSNS